MKRVLALLAAVAMIGGAFVVRSRIIDSDGSDGGPGKPSNGSALTIGCAPELTDVCEAVAGKDIKVLADPIDIDNAAESAANLDAWLTYGPAPGIVNASETNQAKVFDEGTVVGSGRLAVISTDNRLAALARRCKVALTRLTWKCLVDAADRNWSTLDPSLSGRVKVGVGQPSSALGTILTGPFALATADRADPGIDEIDTQAVGRVVSSVDQQPPEDELNDLTTRGPGAYSVVVAPERAARRAAESARGQSSQLRVLYPGPVATTVVVLAPPSGRRIPQGLLDALDAPQAQAALLAAGWMPTRQGRTTGLPEPDVLFALRQEITR